MLASLSTCATVVGDSSYARNSSKKVSMSNLALHPARGGKVAEKWVSDPSFGYPCDTLFGAIRGLDDHSACLVTFVPVAGAPVAAPVVAASATAEITPDGEMFPIGVCAEPPQYPGAGGEVEVSVENGVVTLDVSVEGLPAIADWDVWIDADGITEGDASTSNNWRLMGPKGLSTDSDGAGRFNVSLPWEAGDHVWAVFINDPLPVGLTVMVSHNVAFRVGR